MISTPAARVSGWVCPPAVVAALLWSFLGAGAFLLVVFSYFEGFPVALFTLGCFLLGMWKREYLFCLLLIQLPFWGKSPEYWQKPLLDINILVLLMLQCGGVLSRGRARRVYADPVLLLLAVLVLVSIIGAVPSLLKLWELALSQDTYQTYGMTLFAQPGFRFNVVRRLLSLVLCAGIFLYVRQQDAGFEERAARFIWVVAVAALGIGWMKFFGFFEEPSFLTPLVSTYSWTLKDSPLRQLTSSFTNPMWYAEYLLLVLPFFLVRIFRERGWGFFLALSLLCILSLGLTFERTAWVASAATVLIVLAIATHRAWRHTLPRRAVGRFSVLVVSLAVFAVVLYLSLPSEVLFHKVKHFTSSPRIYLWKTTIPMIRKAPWLGHGIGSFTWAYEGNVPPKARPLHYQTAHDTYLHMGVEMGIPWTLAFLALAAYAVVHGMRRPRDSLEAQAPSIGIMVTAAVVGLGVYIFFIRAIELLFWVCLGLALRGSGRSGDVPAPQSSERATPHPIPHHLFLFFLGICVAVGVVGALRFWPVATGFYGWEIAPDGSTFRWTRPRATACIPVRGDTVKVLVAVGHPDASPEDPVMLDFRVNGSSVQTYELGHPGAYELSHTLTPQERRGGRIQVGWRLDRGWMWSSWPVDERILGVQVRGVEWE